MMRLVGSCLYELDDEFLEDLCKIDITYVYTWDVRRDSFRFIHIVILDRL